MGTKAVCPQSKVPGYPSLLGKAWRPPCKGALHPDLGRECIHWALKSAHTLERENCRWKRRRVEVVWNGNRLYQNTLHACMNSQAIIQDSSMAKRSQGAEQRPVSHDTYGVSWRRSQQSVDF